MNITNIRSVLIVGTTLSVVFGLLFLLFRVLQPFFFIFLAAFVLSVFLFPLFTYLHKKLGFPKPIAAITSILISILIVSIPLSIIATLLINETGQVIAFIQSNTGMRNELTQTLYGYLNQLGISTKSFESEVNKYVIASLSFVSTSLTAILSQTFGLILNGFLTLLVTLYFLIHKETIIHYIFSIKLLSYEDTNRLTARATDVMTATIRGNFIVMAIQAILGGIGFTISGLSSPALLGMLYGLASIIPVVGIAAVWIPGALYLLLTGNLISGVGLAAWCLISNLLMDNVISPRIVARETRLHPLFILFGVLGGINVFGISGLILGPTIIALSFIALEMYRHLLSD